MINATLVDATDLPLWATRLDARAMLPQLVRRLVLASGGRVDRIDFRAGEGVQLEGWDGLVEAGAGNAFVPEGVSGWEMGTNQTVKDKADGDYSKRSADPLVLDPSRTTFVFITPRRWSNKAAWATAKRREGRWKDVRAYDADDLATWLEQTPAVHIWFSMVVGKCPVGVQDLSWYWAGWAGATQPRLSPELVIAGRQSAVDEIQQWLGGQPSALEVQGAARDEAVAFLAAVLQQLPEQEREQWLARCIVVEDAAAWQQLASSRTPLILIPTFADRAMVSQSVTVGHHVFIPLDRSEPVPGKAVQLPRIRRDAAKKALEGMGIPREPAEDLATLARQSLAALRRKLASTPGVLTPLWAEPQAARALVPTLFAGRWRDDHPADREVIARLATKDYREVNETLLRWANAADPPVRRVGDTWMVVSNEDAWSLLARYLTRDDLERFEAVVLDVLGAVDPRYELPLGERWAAPIYGRTLSHSGDLREWLAEALALMGASSDLYPLADARTGQAWATRIVRRLFEHAQGWPLWASLAGHLRLLAEAAPDEFLAAVERGLTDEPPMLVNLFTDAEYHSMEGSPHTGLLWALELLAWSPEYLGHAATLLAKLARLDPGGTLDNRPMRSLQLIFLCWHPGTSAPLEQRLRVLDTLRQREPQIAWSLLVSLLPGRIRTAFNTAEPRWRPWLPDERPTTMTYGELFRVTQELSQRLITDVGIDGGRWHDFIEALAELPKDAFEAIIERLRQLDPLAFSSTDRLNIWDSLRSVISKHLEFPNAAWALPREQVEHLEAVYMRFEPNDPVVQRSWLFVDRPPLSRPGFTNWREREHAVQQARVQAVQELLALGGLTLVLDLARQVKRPWDVGMALGQSNIITDQEDEDRLLSDILGAPDTALRQMAFGFLRGRVAVKGRAWLQAVRRRKAVQTWTPQQRADLYQYLPFSARTWKALESTDDDTQGLYWQDVSIFGRGDIPRKDSEHAIRKFIEYGRLDAAVELLSLYSSRANCRFKPQFIADVLEQVVQKSITQTIAWESLAHDIAELLDLLQQSAEMDNARLAQLEWFFLPLLDRFEREPKTLHRTLADAPDFFVEVLSWAYKAEEEEPRELSETEQVRGRLAADLLHTWRRPPGIGGDGAVNPEQLRTWVTRARELAAVCGRGKIGDQYIGQVLIHYPRGADGAWPHEAVRDLLEDIASEHLERGISVGIFNSRGVVQRAIGEGGAQERTIAERYAGYARVLRDGWPRTARLMRAISNRYEADARGEDTEAELEEDLWC